MGAGDGDLAQLDAPLIPSPGRPQPAAGLRSHLEGGAAAAGGRSLAGLLGEVERQVWLAGPLVAVSLLQYCLQVISLMFVGHLGELALSGASMATSFANVTGFSVLVRRSHLPLLPLTRDMKSEPDPWISSCPFFCKSFPSL